LEDERAWFLPLEESEDGNRASFPRWGKRSVISYHFTEFLLEITVLGMLTILSLKLPVLLAANIIYVIYK
jgi:hypothetical protein